MSSVFSRIFRKTTSGAFKKTEARQMTPDEERAFDEVFVEMDKTFAAMDRLFKTIRKG